MPLKEIDMRGLSVNPMTLIGQEWMLITAGNADTGCNTMTAAWGHLGMIWNKPTATIYIRPQRFTREFVDQEAYFTLAFFDESWKKQLGYLGTVSGRDEEKIANAGLTPVFGDDTVWFEEAQLVLVCRKLYRQELDGACFTDASLVERNYPQKDFHIQYVGEIVKVLAKP